MPQLIEDARAAPAVRGFLHTPEAPSGHGLVLTHGAGGNANAPLLVSIAEAFAASGITVLRFDLPFRQTRPRGSPYPAMSIQDRAGIKRAVYFLRERLAGPVYLGGQSYGGRQSTMTAAEDPGLAAGLLLLSYPLHPPGRSADLRTAHFPTLNTPAMFVHGTRDPFGSIDELNAALAMIPAPHELVVIAGVGHDLGGKGKAAAVTQTVLDRFLRFAKLVP